MTAGVHLKETTCAGKCSGMPCSGVPRCSGVPYSRVPLCSGVPCSGMPRCSGVPYSGVTSVLVQKSSYFLLSVNFLLSDNKDLFV